MAVTAGDVVRIVARMALFGANDIVNVFHFLIQANTFADDLAYMAGQAQIMDDLYTLVNPSINAAVSYISVDGQNVSKAELLPSASWPILAVGGGAGEMLPEMNAACCFFRTTTPRVRASKFLPPYSEGTNIDGAVSAPSVLLLEAFGDFLVADIVRPNLTENYVSFNRITSVATPVVSRVVPSRFRTQRRRRVGVGS